MNDPSHKPASALTLWLNSLRLSKSDLSNLSEIQDGEILWQVLATLDSNFFRAPRPSSMSGTMSEPWVLRFTSFKKMYKLILRYFEEELRKRPKEEGLNAPDLQKIAKHGDLDESVSLSMLILTLSTLVQPDLHVPKIQSLPTWAQTALMLGIQSTTESLQSLDKPSHSTVEQELQNDERNEKDGLQLAHTQLIKEYQLLRKSKDETDRRLILAEEELKVVRVELNSLREKVEEDENKKRRNRAKSHDDHDDDDDDDHIEEEEEEDKDTRDVASDSRRPDYYLLRNELEHLKDEVVSLGTKLDLSENENENLNKKIDEQRKRIDELNDVDEQNRGLRDQLDEVKHEIERARKLEHVIEKYKKKLDESADTRRQLKTLEEQNTEILDRNAKLEDEYRKVSAFKPLMEQYKTQIATLESSLGNQRREKDRLSYELETVTSRLQQVEEEREREGEELALFESRVKELEEEIPLRRSSKADTSELIDDSFDVRAAEEETGIIAGIGGELNDAIEGRTMTSLKLELRKLKRQLRLLKKTNDGLQDEEEVKSRVVVLENLLEDSNRMKRKYEDDYLNVYREKLVISNQLEEIRSGKSISGDGPEASIALRFRLNETVDELERLKVEHTELTVAHEQVSNELTTAKSDLLKLMQMILKYTSRKSIVHLVGKDQIEILSSLRESISTEKIGLMNEVERLKNEINLLRDSLKMKTDQIQSLLLEKIHLQSDTIDQREMMLRRERELSNQTTGGGGGDSNDDQIRLGVLERICREKEEEMKIVKSKLEKARMFIVEQHQMIQSQAGGNGNGVKPIDISSLTNSYEEMDQTSKAEIRSLKEQIERLKTELMEINGRYEKELRLMGSAWYNLSQQTLRETIALNRKESSNQRNSNLGIMSQGGGGNVNGFGGVLRPQSWVRQQRDRLMSRDGL
ncbi:uncharacterized protein MELLADRAFT_90125 [Melampsora larici-populina 98AG31]|uniref:HOOK N-terminal domain-containing protein n=1 Tax=Melampsora larici-populina (strain 98AG31 / pathotype 3-4-7) TaxID=747676 RepID=F4RVS3_MELLP|nr:uncharacterized protein MELLADRAFT_90125 [Melampsora larici-populina 98AG31]EGG03534.1 hypothetical protein MELLADRAFT_90125 [Melampsora larici-populina 98AG31]